ncbi:MAG: preprotein translocase subunit SecE [Gammaproteobacteria bacterium]|nr:preprotein translocase subunit SecE [Gammaproteobacteria bacterium]NNC97735.1 preprotein translocase subunit SecE [Gammaproteobacteria bacterium]NNM14837.1 preprotein translocase subunit SecE [Gammaproteobacteria bacterium]
MATVTDNATSASSKILIALALLLLLAGVFGYYYFIEQSSLYAVGSVFAGAILGALVFFQSSKGKQLWSFGRISFREMKKVVWPTPNEAFQTSLIVIAFCLLMGGFFWFVDWLMLLFINGIGELGK